MNMLQLIEPEPYHVVASHKPGHFSIYLRRGGNMARFATFTTETNVATTSCTLFMHQVGLIPMMVSKMDLCRELLAKAPNLSPEHQDLQSEILFILNKADPARQGIARRIDEA